MDAAGRAVIRTNSPKLERLLGKRDHPPDRLLVLDRRQPIVRHQGSDVELDRFDARCFLTHFGELLSRQLNPVLGLDPSECSPIGATTTIMPMATWRGCRHSELAKACLPSG